MHNRANVICERPLECFTTTGQKSWQFLIILWLHFFILKFTALYDPWVLRNNPGAVFRCFAQQFLTDCSVVRRFSIAFHEHLFEHPLSSHQDQLRHSTHLKKHWNIDTMLSLKNQSAFLNWYILSTQISKSKYFVSVIFVKFVCLQLQAFIFSSLLILKYVTLLVCNMKI